MTLLLEALRSRTPTADLPLSPTLETLDRVAAALEVELVVGFQDAEQRIRAAVVG